MKFTKFIVISALLASTSAHRLAIRDEVDELLDK